MYMSVHVNIFICVHQTNPSNSLVKKSVAHFNYGELTIEEEGSDENQRRQVDGERKEVNKCRIKVVSLMDATNIMMSVFESTE